MRLIDADALDYELGIEDRDIYVRECLQNAPTIDIEPHWIPCKERLPKEERKAYWCCDESGYQFQARWTNNTLGICESDRWGWSICDVPQYSHVVAYMPLPESYKEVTE